MTGNGEGFTGITRDQDWERKRTLFGLLGTKIFELRSLTSLQIVLGEVSGWGFEPTARVSPRSESTVGDDALWEMCLITASSMRWCLIELGALSPSKNGLLSLQSLQDSIQNQTR